MTYLPQPQGAPSGPGYFPPSVPPPAAGRISKRAKLLLAGGALIVLVAVAAIVVTLLVSDGELELTTEGGTTYTVTNVTTAANASEIEDLFPLGPNQRLNEPTGTYVAVQMQITGGGEDPKSAPSPVLVDGNGEELKPGITSWQYTEGKQDTRTELYDVPSDAVSGSQLKVTEAGRDYALDLGL